MTDRELLNLAVTASEQAYAPYSGLRTGAALECEDGSVFLGCSIENAAYGESVCAGRVAVWKAVSEGRRAFVRLALAAETSEYCLPCGACRQILQEFSPEIEVLSARKDGHYVSYRLRELLPKNNIRELLADASAGNEG